MRAFSSLTVVSTFFACAYATPVPLGRATGPTVQIAAGTTIVGSTDAVVDSFKGIPFAQPPIGNLRLKPPQPITGSLGTVHAIGLPRSCPQLSLISGLNLSSLTTDVINEIQGSPFFSVLTDTGEDCLTLNVQRPANIDSSAKLPVLVWIFGGGFQAGSTQIYDATSLIKSSIAAGAPFVFVAMNFRISGFGFLAGKELQADGSTNLGLRDQRLALEWVQDNINSFGGDPTKVTLWGESSGAISVYDHTIINGGDHSYKNGTLFRATIMNSGSIVPTEPVDTPKAQQVYDTIVGAAGCSSASDTLACLRQVDYSTFLAATNALPGVFSYRALDLAYLPRPDPNDNFFSQSPDIAAVNGNFVKVPVIIGDQQDEGTLFSLSQFNITNTDEIVTYLASYFPTNPNATALVADLVARYPSITQDGGASGSPYDTGIFNNIYPEFKRLAAILGDITFTLPRRAHLASLAIHAAQVPSWTYLSTYLYGTPVLGTLHASDIPFDFGIVPSTIPTDSIMRYYTSFVSFLDPNALGNSAPLVNWPKWDLQSRGMLNFGLLENKVIADNFRESAWEYITSHGSDFRV